MATNKEKLAAFLAGTPIKLSYACTSEIIEEAQAGRLLAWLERQKSDAVVVPQDRVPGEYTEWEKRVYSRGYRDGVAHGA